MAINAYNKVINTILSRLVDYKLKTSREIIDIIELEEILKKSTGHGYSLDVVRNIYQFENVSTKEYVYDNGLIYLDSKINYRDNTGNLHTIRQLTLTTDYEKAPLVNMVIQKERNAVQQPLIKSDSKDEIFPELMKGIEIQKTTIHVDKYCGSVFQTYTNLNDGSLISEQYMQYYRVSNSDDSKKLDLCGRATRYLEIFYHESEPTFDQFPDKFNVNIVEKMNEEVLKISTAINRLIDKHQKETKQFVKIRA